MPRRSTPPRRQWRGTAQHPSSISSRSSISSSHSNRTGKTESLDSGRGLAVPSPDDLDRGHVIGSCSFSLAPLPGRKLWHCCEQDNWLVTASTSSLAADAAASSCVTG